MKDGESIVFRFIKFDEKTQDIKLLTCSEQKHFLEYAKYLDWCSKNDIPICINENDIVDSDYPELFVESIRLVVPKLAGETLGYIEVLVD